MVYLCDDRQLFFSVCPHSPGTLMARIFYIIVKLDLKPDFPHVSEQSILKRVCSTFLSMRFYTFVHILCQNDQELQLYCTFKTFQVG